MQGVSLFVGLGLYFGAMFALLLLIDARLRAAERAHMAAFLRSGFGPVSPARRVCAPASPGSDCRRRVGEFTPGSSRYV